MSWIGLGGGALQEEALDRAPRGGKPREEEVSGLCPSLRTECGDEALPGPGANSEHCSGHPWHLHRASHPFRACFPTQSLCSFVKPVFRSRLRPEPRGFPAWCEPEAVVKFGLHLGSSPQFRLPGPGRQRFQRELFGN